MTAQVHENLIYEGEQTSMASCPEVPLDHPEIIESSFDDKSQSHPMVGSTACWRGYIGTWEIKNDHFFLKRLQGPYEVLAKDGIHAIWFSGSLKVPRGELLQYVHMGFESVYEREIILKIVDGIIVERLEIDNRPRDASEPNIDGDDLS